MEIREVDPFDDGQVAAWHAVYERSQSHGRAFPNPWPLPEMQAGLRDPGRRRRLIAFSGTVDGAVVCSGTLWLPQLDNLTSAALAVDTDPALRRRGYGAAMLAYLEERAVAESRTLLNTETFYPGDAPTDGAGHDNADFLTHRGYVFGLGDVHRRLELPAEPALLDRLAGEAAPHHAAYLQLAPVGARDDSWVVLACLVVGALVFAVAWVRLLGKTRFREGPIEGLFDLLARRDPHTGHAVAAEPATDEDYSFRSRT